MASTTPLSRFWRLAFFVASIAIVSHGVDTLSHGGVAEPEELLAGFEPVLNSMPTNTRNSDLGRLDGVPAAKNDKCDKCNVPVDQGGCKCDNNCDCKSSGGGISAYFSADNFAQFFLHTNDNSCRHPRFYTYAAFVTAAAAFPGFGTSSSDAGVNKREIAAFMGQISHETTGGWATAPDAPYAWGLCFDEENTPAAYCAASDQFPCNPGQTYHGRGPMQISWNYNYIPAGRAIGFDGLNNPGAVLTDPVIAWKTAIWFWMTASGNKPSCHAVMTGMWSPSEADKAANRFPGFGVVTNIINGGLECGPGHDTGAGPDRIGYFTRYAGILGVDTGSNLSCDNQRSF